MTLNQEEKWAAWWALLEAIAQTPPVAIPRRGTLGAFRKLTAELGERASQRLDDRIEEARIHDVSAMYALKGARGTI